MSFGSRLKELREQKHLKQQDLAEVLGVKNTAVSNYELGISSPKEEVMFKILEFFNVTPNYMFQDEVKVKLDNLFSQQENRMILKYRALDNYGQDMVTTVLEKEYERCTAEPEEEYEPAIQIRHSCYKASAGHGFEFFADEEWDEIDIPDTRETRRADFALTIQGDSMEPVYHDGDIVLVKQQDAVDIGQIGIFVLNGAGYIKKNGGDRLISLNEKYDDIFIEEYDDCRCVGKVIGRV